jgi:phosphoribosylanthranilate isomerase
MKIKVCGLNNAANAAEVSALMVDYCGLIFYEKSPRKVNPGSVIQLAEGINAKANRVGVFVNTTNKEIVAAIAGTGINTIQLHGYEQPEQCCELKNAGYTVIKAFRISESFNFDEIRKYEPYCDFFLFDTATDLHGGSGKKFNWRLLKKYAGELPFFLSGGIGAENAREVRQIKYPRFYGIDINSCFEISPGIKNIDLLKHFMDEIKADN